MFPVTAQGRARDVIGNANNILPFGAENLIWSKARAQMSRSWQTDAGQARVQLRRRAGNIIWGIAQSRLPKQIKLVSNPLPLLEAPFTP